MLSFFGLFICSLQFVDGNSKFFACDTLRVKKKMLAVVNSDKVTSIALSVTWVEETEP